MFIGDFQNKLPTSKMKYVLILFFVLSISLNILAQGSAPENKTTNQQVVLDYHVYEAMLSSADRTITFLQWVIGVFSGVITLLFLIFNYRDQKALEKNRNELKASQDKLEQMRLEMAGEEQHINAMIQKMQGLYTEYEDKISAINNKITSLEAKSRELDKKTDVMNEISRYFSIAYQAVESKNFADAVRYYTKILELSPDIVTQTVVYNNRGIAYQNMGEPAKAIEDYSKVIELNPAHAHAFSHRGNAYFDTGNHDAALKDYTRAIELKPDYADAYFNRANQYIEMKQYALAVNDFTSVLQLIPNDAQAYNRRGTAYLAMGDKEKAKVDFAKAAELEPSNNDYAADLKSVS